MAHASKFLSPTRRLAGLTLLLVALAGLLVVASPASAAPKQKAQCADGIDNDFDGATDYSRRGGDPDCESRKDDSETSAFVCVDTDGDIQRETPPTVPNGTLLCALLTGDVVRLTCDVGYHDIDGSMQNGCEYGPIYNPGPEECDGLDNDADGQFDEGLVLPEVPNGVLACHQGAVVVFCEEGFADANSDPGDGCEAATSVAARAGG